MKTKATSIMKEVKFHRVNKDFCGNPRVVVHYLDFIADNEELSIEQGYDIARERAKKLGGTIYRGSDFGGGFVFQCYNERLLSEQILELVESISNDNKLVTYHRPPTASEIWFGRGARHYLDIEARYVRNSRNQLKRWFDHVDGNRYYR